MGRFVLHAANAASPPMDISNHAVCLTRGMALRPSWSKLISSIASARSCPIGWPLCICSASTCDATVRGTYSKPEAGARTAWCLPRGKLPCASSTCSTQEAGTRSPYVQYGGPARTCQHRPAPTRPLSAVRRRQAGSLAPPRQAQARPPRALPPPRPGQRRTTRASAWACGLLRPRVASRGACRAASFRRNRPVWVK